MTPKQKKCLDFIKRYTKSNGCSPSYQEMADYLGLFSKSNVYKIIQNLKEQGYIEDTPNKYRSIKLCTPCKNCKKLEKQLDMAIRCLEKYADHQNWQDECAGAEDCLYIDDFAYRDAETVLEQIKELNK